MTGFFTDEFGGVRPERVAIVGAVVIGFVALRIIRRGRRGRLTDVTALHDSAQDTMPASDTPDTTPNLDGSVPINFLHDRVLVREDTDSRERRSLGGIVIPVTAQVGRRARLGEGAAQPDPTFAPSSSATGCCSSPRTAAR